MTKNMTREEYAKICGNVSYGTCKQNYAETQKEYAGHFTGSLTGNADTATALKNNWQLNLTKDVQGTAILNNSNTNMEVTVLESKHAVNADNAKQTQECAHSSLADLANLATFALEAERAHNAIKTEQDKNGDIIHDTYLKIKDGVLKSEYLKTATVSGKAHGSGIVTGTDLKIVIDEIANNITNNFIFINEETLPAGADTTKIYVNASASLLWVYNYDLSKWQEIFTDVRGEIKSVETIAKKALPLTGGTLTGTLKTTNKESFFRNVNTDELRIGGGTSSANGATIFLFGKDSNASTGKIILRARDNNSYKDLNLSPNGEAKWGNTNLVRSIKNVKANSDGDVNLDGVYLLKTGGTITGTISFNTTAITAISKIDDTSHIMFLGGSSWEGGSSLVLYGKEHSNHPGRVALSCKTDSASAGLILEADGNARWAGKNLVRTVNGATADTAGNINISGVPTGSLIPFAGAKIPTGFLLCNGATVSRITYANLFSVIGEKWGAGDGSTTFNLPDFSDRYIKGTTNADNVGQFVEAGLPNITGETNSNNKSGSHLGAFYSTTSVHSYFGDNIHQTVKNLGFNASMSNNIYGKSKGVEVASNQVLIIIKT